MIVDQTEFQQAVLDPDAARPEGLLDGVGQPAGRRFDVYRNNVAVSLGEALETAFPVVRKLVGDQNFKTLASVFLRQHPPSSPLMMFYGAEMPTFLEAFEPAKSIGYLPDIARLEVALRESYHAEDSTPVDPNALQAMAPDDLMAATLTLAPSLRVVPSPWPIYAIWAFNSIEGTPKPQMAPEDVLVLRPDMDPEPKVLPSGGATFVNALLQNESLGSALEIASAENNNFDLPATLTLLIGAGAITRIGD